MIDQKWILDLDDRGYLREYDRIPFLVFTSESSKESCFKEISKEAAIHLFQFPEFVAKGKKSPEKMFRMLDLYDAISELWPEIESIFSFQSTSAVKSQAVSSLLRLGDAVRSMLSDFESAIQKDTSKSPVPGGGLHPLTRYVMNYVSFLSDYCVILSDIVADFPLPVQTPLPDSYFEIPFDFEDNATSAMVVRFAWIILVLLCKLDGKTELYKDVSLSYLFLANNLHYVISKVKNSNLKFLLGEDWITKHELKVKQYASNYERMAWSKVLSSLPNNPTAVISLEAAKECFHSFSSAFETAYRTQSSWVVTDGKLRDEIKVSIAKKIGSAYRAFYDTNRGRLRDEKNFESLVRFSPDDLGNYLSDLFYGARVSGSTSSSNSTPASSTHHSSRSR
ncbi:Exocyst complex protein Exo70 [Macleaya cordata]|uniref:Exocyst subunit Exo70 family protein n=1 Tax=Macleaya cordata TaxID=56857 RepID=A0A200PZC0_MACCD|nr:Exocyst complex protein Exo70 [Macleaya cordata]